MPLARKRGMKRLLLPLVSTLVLTFASPPAFAHCDSLDGPVVIAAREALRAGDVTLVLGWVRKGDEPEIRAVFDKTMTVRKLGPQAQDLADTHFFETLVRIHRAGEDAPYTGLKPAGRDLGPAIPAADRALRTGDVEPLVKLLNSTARDGVRERFKRVVALRGYRSGDVEAGRRYVDRYVVFIHYVEGLYEAATRTPDGHHPDTASTGAHVER